MGKIECPLVGKVIEEAECFDMSMVAEGMAPQNTVPDMVIKIPEFKRICLDCPNHRE